MKTRLTIAKKIQLQVIDELFEEIDQNLPDIQMSSDEIQKEINAYRNDKKRQN